MPQMPHYNALSPGEIIKIIFNGKDRGSCLFSSVRLYRHLILTIPSPYSWALCSEHDTVPGQLFATIGLKSLQLPASCCSLEVYNFFYKILLKLANSPKIMTHEEERIRRSGKKKIFRAHMNQLLFQ